MSLNKKNNISSILGEYKSNIYEKLKTKNLGSNFMRRNPSQNEKSYILKNNSQIDKLILIDKSHEKKRIIANNFDINSKYETNSSFNNNISEYMKSGNTKDSDKYSNSLSKILVDNIQYKGNLIKSLKNNCDDRFFRKKSLNDNTVQKRNESLELDIEAHKKNNSFAYNSNVYKQYRNNSSGKKIDMTWDLPNDMSVHPKTLANEISFEAHNKCTNCNGIKKQATECEKSLDDMLKTLKQNDNVSMLKLNKKILEEISKIQPEFTKIVFRLINGYNDMFQGSEYKQLKEKSDSYDVLINKYSHLNKKYLESNKVIEEKNEEIRKLKEKIIEMDKMRVSELSSANILSTQSNGREEKIVSEHDNNITNINKKLVEDLDGLYFYDKIHMKSQSIIEIPKLDFNFDKKKSDKESINVSNYDSDKIKKMSNGILNKDNKKYQLIGTPDQIKTKLMSSTVKK